MQTTQHSNQRGFTIVELLIAIVVLAILVGIGVVGYTGWRQSTLEAQVKSDLNGVASAMEAARNFGDGYPVSVPTTFTPSDGVLLTGGGSVDGTTFCIEGTTSADTSIQLYIDSTMQTSGAQDGTCP